MVLWKRLETQEGLTFHDLVASLSTLTLTTTAAVGTTSDYEPVCSLLTDDKKDAVVGGLGYMDVEPIAVAQAIEAAIGPAGGGATRVVPLQTAVGDGRPGGVVVDDILLLETPLRFMVIMSGAVYVNVTVFAMPTGDDKAWCPVGPFAGGETLTVSNEDFVKEMLEAAAGRATVASRDMASPGDGPPTGPVWDAFAKVLGSMDFVAAVPVLGRVTTGDAMRMSKHVVRVDTETQWDAHAGLALPTPARVFVDHHTQPAPKRAESVVFIPPRLTSFPIDIGRIGAIPAKSDKVWWRLNLSVAYRPTPTELFLYNHDVDAVGAGETSITYGTPSPWDAAYASAVITYVDHIVDQETGRGVVLNATKSTNRVKHSRLALDKTFDAVMEVMQSVSGGGTAARSFAR